jgi:hypothetical protein
VLHHPDDVLSSGVIVQSVRPIADDVCLVHVDEWLAFALSNIYIYIIYMSVSSGVYQLNGYLLQCVIDSNLAFAWHVPLVFAQTDSIPLPWCAPLLAVLEIDSNRFITCPW